MKITLTALCYCLEITLDQMLQVLENDERNISKGAATLCDLLQAAGARDIEYDGHFGAAVFFSLVEDEQDQLANIILLVNSYANMKIPRLP